MLDEQTLEKRIDAANEMFISDEEVEPAATSPDVYKNKTSASTKEFKKRHPRGSSPMVLFTTQSVINGDGVPRNGLAQAFERAKEESAALRERGEGDRADMVIRQYTEERLWPAIEVVIRYSSPDELLNCKDALAALDKYALGTGRQDGYTASYVRTAYANSLGKDLNNSFDRSDPDVQDAVRIIRMTVARDDYRSAVGAAHKIKKSIDNGEHLASEADYELIGRVAAYGR